MLEVAFLAVALVGIIHGLEPGHGWPVAVLYSLRSAKPLIRAFLSSSVISLFHLVSSVAVVFAYVLLRAFFDFTLPYVNYIAAGALAILGIRFLMEKNEGGERNHGHFHEDFGRGVHAHEHYHSEIGKHSHPHEHTRRVILSLSGIAAFAFVLGFAHEEEFALLAFAVGGINPLTLMLVYASAVTVGLIGITILAVLSFRRIESRLSKYEHWLPKVSGIVLLLMAFSFVIGLR